MAIAAKRPEDTTVVVAGATGYIGKFAARECVRRGYKTIALTRKPGFVIEGAEMVVADVTDVASVKAAMKGRKVGGGSSYRVVDCSGLSFLAFIRSSRVTTPGS